MAAGRHVSWDREGWLSDGAVDYQYKKHRRGSMRATILP